MVKERISQPSANQKFWDRLGKAQQKANRPPPPSPSTGGHNPPKGKGKHHRRRNR